MLSEEEKREMLADGKNYLRRNDFRIVKERSNFHISFDDYLLFLNDIQKVFTSFKISLHKTVTRLNKL